jgi:hypothetical protein
LNKCQGRMECDMATLQARAGLNHLSAEGSDMRFEWEPDQRTY